MSRAHPPLQPFGGGFAPTGSESASFDRFAIDEVGVPQPVLMENAGRGAAQVLAHLFPQRPVVVLVGSGNNGGDGLVLARTLRAWGRDVSVVLVSDRDESDPLLHGWDIDLRRDPGEDEWTRLLSEGSLAVDAVLGTGVRGAPREREAAAIRRVNESGVEVLALDVPSGVDADTGAVPGEAVRAAVTVAFGAPKLGSLLHPARSLTGRLVALEIGFPPWDASTREITGELISPAWVGRRRPMRDPDTHKNAEGRVLVVAGADAMAGAAILTAQAAFRTGAGYVRVASFPANRTAIHAALPEAVFVDVSDAEALAAALEASDAVVLGPGLGTDGRAAAVTTAVFQQGDIPLLIDADGLNLVAAGACDLGTVSPARAVLLTPHPGEMARLLQTTTDEVALDRVAALRSSVDRFGRAVLLKGAPSLVAAPDTRVLVDTQGTSDLAVAGMGDTLAGACSTFLALGRPPEVAGALGLHFTGRAARLAGRGAALVPSDVIRHLADALAEEATAETDLDLPGVLFDAEPAR